MSLNPSVIDCGQRAHYDISIRKSDISYLELRVDGGYMRFTPNQLDFDSKGFTLPLLPPGRYDVHIVKKNATISDPLELIINRNKIEFYLSGALSPGEEVTLKTTLQSMNGNTYYYNIGEGDIEIPNQITNEFVIEKKYKLDAPGEEVLQTVNLKLKFDRPSKVDLPIPWNDIQTVAMKEYTASVGFPPPTYSPEIVTNGTEVTAVAEKHCGYSLTWIVNGDLTDVHTLEYKYISEGDTSLSVIYSNSLFSFETETIKVKSDDGGNCTIL